MGCKLSPSAAAGVTVDQMTDGYPYVVLSGNDDGPAAGDIVQRVGDTTLVGIGDGSDEAWDVASGEWTDSIRFRRLEPPEKIEIT